MKFSVLAAAAALSVGLGAPAHAQASITMTALAVPCTVTHMTEIAGLTCRHFDGTYYAVTRFLPQPVSVGTKFVCTLVETDVGGRWVEGCVRVWVARRIATG